MLKRGVWLGLLAACLLLAGSAAAESLGLACRVGESADTVVYPCAAAGEDYLLLPSQAHADELTLTFEADGKLTAEGDAGRTASFSSGEPWDMTSLFNGEPEDGKYRVTFRTESGEAETVVVMFSANLRSVFITSDDPVDRGRQWVDGSEHHETSASGRLTVLRADGSAAYEGAMEKIRGRGNSTWGNYPLTYDTKSVVDKKPYQITLSRKADLLDTGDPDEANKRWVLLAEYYDGTLLHNRVSFDLARELGQASAPNCQSVDLYYDGEYRGQYLLTEKVEVGQGRVDVEDYDDILKTVNKFLGIDVKSLGQVVDAGDDGVTLAATDGVEDGGRTDFGGYLVELDRAYYKDERAYFGLPDGSFYTVANPEYASLSMVKWLSGLFQKTGEALANYGVDPDTGESWTDDLDVDSLLPYYWVNELAKNPDTWKSSSTYFVVGAGEEKLSMGPVWDFDQAYYLHTDEAEGVADALTPTNTEGSWAYDLERIPAFQTLAKAFFTQKVVPAVEDVLLGDEDACGTCLRSLAWYWEETAASRRMNDVLWDPQSVFGTIVADTYEENYQNFRSFIAERYAWIADDLAAWPEDAAVDAIAVTLSAPYGNVEDRLTASLDDLHTNAEQPGVELTQLTQATAESYAVWQADVTVEAKPGTAFTQDARVTIDGTEVPAVRNADGSLSVSVCFEDPSYRPAEYDGTDYGLVFNAEYYAACYPEVAALVGDDAGALLAYYVEYGLAESQVANAFFDPEEALECVPDIAGLYGDTAEGAVDYFLDGGCDDLMSTLDKTFEPAVLAEEP